MNLHEKVLMQMRDLILWGELAPGSRLGEQQLAERLHVSRTPVRAALVSLEQEGLVEANDTVGYVVRRFTPQEIADAISVRGHLEGMAARLVAEHGLNRQLGRELRSCLDQGDSVVTVKSLTEEDYARYGAMNARFHGLLVEACGNRALQRAIDLNNKLPFASASALLPMEGTFALDRDSMIYAHRQHHMLFDALERGEGARAQALAVEHTEVAKFNLRQALEHRSESEHALPAMKLVIGL